MDWDIRFNTGATTYRLGTLAECEIDSSVDNLADTAIIVLPEAVMNQVISIQDKVTRGSTVSIKLGYDNNLVDEFEGFVEDIITVDSSLKIKCEDALFLYRTSVKDEELKPTSIKNIAQSITEQINPEYTVNCDYDVHYEKFTIHQATGYDVLKKLQEETKANIYFDTQNKVLHIHPPYTEKGGEVTYSMHHNIEQSSLEWKRASDKKIEVTVESTDINGKVKKVIAGTTGGDKITLKVGPMSESDIKKVADAALRKHNFDGYDGTLDGWLLPVCKPTYSAKIIDADYPERVGSYYVVAVKTSFNESGGKRTVTPGIKLN